MHTFCLYICFQRFVVCFSKFLMFFSIKIWDAGELSVHYSYLPAHTDVVSSVATQPKSNNVFASCCWAGEALIWDIRNSKHAKGIITNHLSLTFFYLLTRIYKTVGHRCFRIIYRQVWFISSWMETRQWKHSCSWTRRRFFTNNGHQKSKRDVEWKSNFPEEDTTNQISPRKVICHQINRCYSDFMFLIWILVSVLEQILPLYARTMSKSKLLTASRIMQLLWKITCT